MGSCHQGGRHPPHSKLCEWFLHMQRLHDSPWHGGVQPAQPPACSVPCTEDLSSLGLRPAACASQSVGAWVLPAEFSCQARRCAPQPQHSYNRIFPTASTTPHAALHALCLCRDLSNNKQLCGSLPKALTRSAGTSIRAVDSGIGQPCSAAPVAGSNKETGGAGTMSSKCHQQTHA